MEDRSSRLFITSDSAVAIANLTDRFRNRTLTVPGPILHIDRPAAGVNRVEGITKVIGDFYALGECHTSILTHSGYSALANRRRLEPYDNLYKYDSSKKRIEHCDDVYESKDRYPPSSDIHSRYCRVFSNDSTRDIR